MGQLTILNSLDLSDNAIEVLPLSLKNLKDNLVKLKLGKNKIDDISLLADLVNLEELNLKSVKFNRIAPITELTKLTKLNVSKNKLRDQDISSLSKLVDLKELNVKKNKITDVELFAPFTLLEELDLSDNEIEDVSNFPKTLTNLRVLNLSDNNISNVVSLVDITSLEEFIMDGTLLDKGEVVKTPKNCPTNGNSVVHEFCLREPNFNSRRMIFDSQGA